MKEVVLHAADDVAEGREVGGEHAVLVHALHRVGNAGVTHDGDEQIVGMWVSPHPIIDEVAVLPDKTDGAGPYALDLRMGLQDVEYIDEGDGVATEDVVLRHLEKAAARLESLVDRNRWPEPVME